jgi:hypothetical protein
LRSTDTLAPVERIETVKGIALLALAVRAASTIIENVDLATSHWIRIAILPAIGKVAHKVALTCIGQGSIVDASDPVGNGVRVEVRAREDIAITSVVVISRK